MSILERVEIALDGYVGMSLRALSIGAEDWHALCAELGQRPDEFGAVYHRSIPLQCGAFCKGVNYVVGA